MRIVVCLTPATHDASLTALAAHDAHAVEAALQIAEARRADGAPVELAVVACAPAEALGVVRGALAMGMQRGAIVESAVRDDDVVGQAEAMAAWLRDHSPDLVVSCPWSGDIGGTLFLAATADRAGLPVLTGARRLRIDDEADGPVAVIDRQTEFGDESVAARLPCVVEVSETINQARYPTVKGRARAQNLAIDLVRRPTDREPSRVEGSEPSPLASERDTVVIDDPVTAASAIVEFLREREVV